MEIPQACPYKKGMRRCRGMLWGTATLFLLPQSGASDVFLLLPKAKDVEAFQRRLEAEQNAQIEKSLGSKFAEAGKIIDLFKTNAVPPEESQPQELHVLSLPIEGMKDAQLALAANSKGEVAAAAVISGKSVDKSWAPFLFQFVGSFGLRLAANSENLPATLAERQKKASPSGSDEAKKLHALLTQKQLMWENGALNERLYEQVRAKNDKAGATAKEYAKLLGQLVDFSPKMSVVLEAGELKTYQDHFQSMKKASDQLAAQAGKGDWDNVAKNLRGIQNRCGRCHAWDGTHYQKPLEGAMMELRQQLGIDKGYFVVGHDVQLPDGVKKEEAQIVASAVKKGLWILKFSFAGN